MKIEVDGATLYVEVDGPETHPALLLWPPGRCTLRIWDDQVTKLIERFRTVRIDIRGLGRSSPSADPESQCTFEQYAKDACDVLDHLGIERCHIWSQSWGTRPAIAFCALHPDRVMSAALYAANTDEADVPAQQEGSRVAAAIRREAGIESGRPPKGFFDHDYPEAVDATMAATQKFDLAAVVDKLTMPVLIGTGSHDPNLVSSRVIAATAPNARLAVLENVGHNSMFEYPELALQTFLDFHDELET